RRNAITSASCVARHAVDTMARSSRRLGAKMPGVSMKTSCEHPSRAIPRISARVVCTLWVTIDTLAPTSALTRVDLPTFGPPTIPMNPQRLPGAATLGAVSPIGVFRADPLAHEHGGGGGLLGRAFRTPAPFGRLA